jgi:hypothetical protein
MPMSCSFALARLFAPSGPMRRYRPSLPRRCARQGSCARVEGRPMCSAIPRHGASLQEIGTLLRHRSIETTEIYAKVHVTALQRIAQAWPEVEPC